MRKRVADIIVETLVEYGITDCFAVVGGGAMHLDNALLLCKDMNKYFNHHEQACAMAADAYARYSGKMAAVCVTSGPGATNTLTGVVGAWQDSLPMIILSGQVRYEISVPKSGLNLRYRGIQEFQIVPTVKNMTKYAVMLTNPLEVKREVVKAIRIAYEGRRGPVWLDIPQDIQNVMVEEDELYPVEEKKKMYFPDLKENIKDLMELLKNAKRPCILAGSGIISSGNRENFEKLVNQLGLPVVGGSWVADNFYSEHELYFGNSGTAGPRRGNFILQNADVILSIGNSLGFRQTGFNVDLFAPKAKIVMVDIDEAEGKKPRLNLYQFIHADIFDFINTMTENQCKILVSSKWMNYCKMLKERFPLLEGGETVDMEERVSAAYFWRVFQKYEEKDSIVALGASTSNSMKLQCGVKYREQRVLVNYACGAMGYDLPAAIGGAIASKRGVYCMVGDGSIMMNIQELQTIVKNDLPIKIVVFSNDGYGAIRQTNKNFFHGANLGCTEKTGISFPDFHKVADTFGFEYKKCRINAEVEEAVQWMVESKKRVWLEIEQKLDDPVLPKLMSRLDEEGKMKSPALHDMYPFLEDEELNKFMIAD